MFASKVATVQTKAAASLTNSLMSQRSTLVAHRLGPGTLEQEEHLLRSTIGNQATVRLLAPRASRQTGNALSGDLLQDAAPENALGRAGSRGAAWDFAKIPLFPPERGRQSQGSSPQPGIIQPKLVVGRAIDRLEDEADRIADHVMGMPDPELSVAAAPARLSRKCAACEEEEAPRLQTKPAGSPKAARMTAPSIVYDVLRDLGQPLDHVVQASVEPLFHHDFSAVRVHSDARAAESAKRVGALAYTVGSDIVFGAGRYSPETKAGRSLLAHELTHVVQQRHAPAKGALGQAKIPIGDPDDRLERQADALAQRFADVGGGFAETSDPALQRQSDHADDEADGATMSQPQPPSGSIDITEELFEEDPGNPGQLQMVPDPTSGALLQRQGDIPPPPPAFPDRSTWFFDFVGADIDFGSLFGLTCQDGRERGFYVMWNERTNKSSAGPVEIGDPAKGCESPHIELGPVPPDRKPIFPVGWFHTHPLANPGCQKLEVGPSQKDKDTSKKTGLPGLVEDTATPTSSCKDGAFFFFGPTVRS